MGRQPLAIILRYYGRIVPLAELRQECGVSRDGSKASNILKAARRYGMIAKGFKKELKSVQEVRPPFIVFWNFNHFLVVEGFRKDRVFLSDPASGRRSPCRSKNSTRPSPGWCWCWSPVPNFTTGGQTPSALPPLSTRLRDSRAALLYCLLTGVLLVVPRLAVPMFTQVFIDNS